ncbi:unnamed protein product, partial [Lampetra planeri]
MMEGVEEALGAFRSTVRKSFDAANTKQAEESLDGAVQTWKESVRRRLMPTKETDIIEALDLAQRLMDRPWYRASVRANGATIPAVPGLYAVGRRSRRHGSGSSSDSDCAILSESSSSESSSELSTGSGRASRRLSVQGLAPSKHAQEVVYLQ